MKSFLKAARFLGKPILVKKTPPLLNYPEEGYIQWPKGYTGSLSHKNNYFAFIIQKNSPYTFGIDLEEKVSKRVFERVTTIKERMIFTFADEETHHCLAFSIKESLFKCLAPILGKEGFTLENCHIKGINPERNTFTGLISLRENSTKLKVGIKI